MIFLTTGEKIRSLRKKFAMRQQELEDENITRAFISMIETGKRGLSRDTARNIAEKLNKKAESLGMSLDIDGDYLTRTPAEDAEVYCLQKLNNLPTKDEIDVIIGVARRHGLTKVEAQAYRVLGDYEADTQNFMQAFINYMISLDLYKNTDDNSFIAYLYNKLGYCKSEQLEYIEAVSFFARACHYSVLFNDKKTEKYSIYNMARSLKKLEKYNEALEYLDKYLEMCNKKEEFRDYFYANVLKANCYNCSQNREKALSIYNELIMDETVKDHEGLSWYIYNNIGAIYLEANNLCESLQYLNKAEQIGMEKDKKNLAWTYIQKGNLYIQKGQFDEALKYANKGLKLSGEFNDTNTTINAYHKLIEIYIELRDFTCLKNSYIKLLDVIKNKAIYKDEVIKIYNKLALLYLEQNDIEMCKKYLQMAS
jgi:tetratricopeptide (TPR) repeat protein